MTQDLATNISVVLNYEIVRLNDTNVYNIGEIFKAARATNDIYVSIMAKVTRIKNGQDVELTDNDMEMIMMAYSTISNTLYDLKVNEIVPDIREQIEVELNKIHNFWG